MSLSLLQARILRTKVVELMTSGTIDANLVLEFCQRRNPGQIIQVPRNATLVSMEQQYGGLIYAGAPFGVTLQRSHNV